MKRVSATLIVCNEERDLPRALESLGWADEVVVVDSGSIDGTVTAARRLGAAVCHRDWSGFVDQKNFAVEKARHPWIFSLDADEVCSVELAAEIDRWRKSEENEPRGFRIPRRSSFLGRWIRHTDWSPDHQLRLFHRDSGRWAGGRVHESVRVDGEVGRLLGPILHYPYADLGEFIRKLDAYSRLAALDLRDRGRRATPWQLVFSPAAAFLKSYLLKRGILDGRPGLVVSGMSAVAKFCRYARLYELEREPDRSEPHRREDPQRSRSEENGG